MRMRRRGWRCLRRFFGSSTLSGALLGLNMLVITLVTKNANSFSDPTAAILWATAGSLRRISRVGVILFMCASFGLWGRRVPTILALLLCQLFLLLCLLSLRFLSLQTLPLLLGRLLLFVMLSMMPCAVALFAMAAGKLRKSLAPCSVNFSYFVRALVRKMAITLTDMTRNIFLLFLSSNGVPNSLRSVFQAARMRMAPEAWG